MGRCTEEWGEGRGGEGRGGEGRWGGREGSSIRGGSMHPADPRRLWRRTDCASRRHAAVSHVSRQSRQSRMSRAMTDAISLRWINAPRRDEQDEEEDEDDGDEELEEGTGAEEERDGHGGGECEGWRRGPLSHQPHAGHHAGHPAGHPATRAERQPPSGSLPLLQPQRCDHHGGHSRGYGAHTLMSPPPTLPQSTRTRPIDAAGGGRYQPQPVADPQVAPLLSLSALVRSGGNKMSKPVVSTG